MIGLIDSGKGGLTTLATIINAGGRGKFYYLADEQNAPYGNKSELELMDILLNNLVYLKNIGCDKVVLACNTLSLLLNEEIELPLPTQKLAFPDYDKSKRTLFVATPYSVKVIEKKRLPNLITLPLPDLAKLIDNEEYTPDYLVKNIQDIEFKQVILGCTHYGFVKKDFKNLFPNANILDMNRKTPLELANSLTEERDVFISIKDSYKKLLSSMVKVKLTYM